MKRNFLWLLLFFSFVLAGGFETAAHAEEQKDSYEIILKSDDKQYELSDKIFKEVIENAYPGMQLPTREIKIINRQAKAVQLEFDIDLVEPDFSWVEGQLSCTLNGVTLNKRKQSAIDQKICLQPNEEVILKTVYQLNGEKITNEHQNRLFKLKWYFRCETDRKDSSGQLPETGEISRSFYLLLFIISLLAVLVTRSRSRKQFK